jgi:hypothetical protein
MPRRVNTRVRNAFLWPAVLISAWDLSVLWCLARYRVPVWLRCTRTALDFRPAGTVNFAVPSTTGRWRPATSARRDAWAAPLLSNVTVPEHPPVQLTVISAAPCRTCTVLGTVACAASVPGAACEGQQPVAHATWPAGQRQMPVAKHVIGGVQQASPHGIVVLGHGSQ